MLSAVQAFKLMASRGDRQKVHSLLLSCQADTTTRQQQDYQLTAEKHNGLLVAADLFYERQLRAAHCRFNDVNTNYVGFSF